MIRIGLIASQGGSVYRAACTHSRWLRDRIALVLADRPCGALDVATHLGHSRVQVDWTDREAFAEAALNLDREYRIDLWFSFYTRLLGPRFVAACDGRLLNFHPSLLPACPGMHGFEDTLRSGALLVGSTVHFVDLGMDTGAPLIQAWIPRDPSLVDSAMRHRIFLQQGSCMIQVARWFEQGRVVPARAPHCVAGASWRMDEFLPNLEHEDAVSFAAALAA